MVKCDNLEVIISKSQSISLWCSMVVAETADESIAILMHLQLIPTRKSTFLPFTKLDRQVHSYVGRPQLVWCCTTANFENE